MGSVTDHFANLTELLTTEVRKGATTTPRIHERDIFSYRYLRPFLPASIRLGTGHVLDVQDRRAGPVDLVACSEAYPVLGEGPASLFFRDGVVFALQVRQSWTPETLASAVQLASDLKQLSQKAKTPLVVGVVGFDAMPFDTVTEFLKSPKGAALDTILTVGQHVVIRNVNGWFGDLQQIPFVSARGGPEALKAFSFLLFQLCQMAIGLPSTLPEYQHL